MPKHATKRPALLDVNVLIALLDVDHLHHARAQAWLADHIGDGWASSPLTQNGCIRVMSQPSYPGQLPPAAVAARLWQATSTAHHRFVADSVSLLDDERFDTDRLLGAAQITDAYLLGLAVTHDLRFVTFDRGVPSLQAVRGATGENLVLL